MATHCPAHGFVDTDDILPPSLLYIFMVNVCMVCAYIMWVHALLCVLRNHRKMLGVLLYLTYFFEIGLLAES